MQLQVHPLAALDLASAIYRQNLTAGGDTVTADTIDPATLPASVASFGLWYSPDDVYHCGSTNPAGGDFAALEIEEQISELRIVTKAKYNTGWITVWEETAPDTWTQIAEFTSNYDLVKAISNAVGVYASWTLPVPLTKYDAAANTDKLPNPGPNDFLNIEFYLSWETPDTTRKLRIVSLGGGEVAQSGCTYWNPVPLYSLDLYVGAVTDVERLPHHVAFQLHGIVRDTCPDVKRLTNDRYSQLAASAGLYASEARYNEQSGQAWCLAGPKTNGNFLGVFRSLAGTVTQWFLREFTADGIFVKETALSAIGLDSGLQIGLDAHELDAAPANPFGVPANALHIDAQDRIYLLLGCDLDDPADDYLVQLNPDHTMAGYVKLPKLLNVGGGYDRRWLGLYVGDGQVWVFRTDGAARRYDTSRALKQVKQITEPQMIGTLAGNANWVFVEGEWAKNSTGEWIHPHGLAHKILVLDSNFNFLRQFGTAGTNAVGAMVSSGGVCVDAQNRVGNQDQNCVQVWKADGGVAQGELAGADQVSHVVGNEHGSLPTWLTGYADATVDPIAAHVIGGMSRGAKYLVPSKTIRTTIEAGTPYTPTQKAKAYGRTGKNLPKWMYHGNANWTSKNMLVVPSAAQVSGNDLLVLDNRRRLLRIDVTTRTAPAMKGRATQDFVATAGQTTFDLGVAFSPTTVEITVDNVAKALRTDSGMAWDARTNPAEFAWSDASVNTNYGKTKNDATLAQETAIATTIVFAAPMVGGEAVAISYVPKTNTANEIILDRQTPVSWDDPVLPAAHRFTIGGGYVWVLLPYANSITVTSDPRRKAATYKGVILKYNATTGAFVSELEITTETGFKSDVRFVTRSGTDCLWVLDRDGAQIREYTLAGALNATYALEITKPERFAYHALSGNIVILGHGGMCAVNTSGADQWHVTSQALLQYAKAVDVDGAGNLWVLAWNHLLKFNGTTRAYMGYVRENDFEDYEVPVLRDLCIDSGDFFLLKSYNRAENFGTFWSFEVSHVRIFTVA